MSQDGPGDSDPKAPVSRAPAEGDSRGSPATRTESEGATVDFPEGVKMFTPGQVLGDRYQILEMLGRGGIGEVWHAFDLKLRVEVALKALREDFVKNERRLEMLRQEVRAAREVMSPNVCRIFDLIEAEGRELVSMEYIDGATLLEVLQDRGPLELKDAQEIASQFLAGLESIHQVGLVHRDVKPENIMLTRAGRVVVMDFGLARQEDSGAGTVAGTPAYMAPEQAAGLKVDARADVYSAGVVLAEMVSPDGIKSHESRQSLWEGVRSEPARLPETPWAPVVKKAVAREPDNRYNTAHTLIRALEDRTFRVEGAEDLHPYPGLASFTEDDAEYFFGREAEVEQMWQKLERPHLAAVIGPSGAGKSSFIRAGLFASAPVGWSCTICTPGNAAFSSLGRVMAREMAGDREVVEQLLDFDSADVAVDVVGRWRRSHDHALLVVDQFEELFTQNSLDQQARFAELLSRLVLDADVCVVLSMRDDFLMRCRDFEALKPIFSEMTALPTLSGQALRRALVQPATKCGYRFEDDALMDEMLAEVEGERGALPLLAFAAARLWDKRDRENGLLTRQAYHAIGGVGGALARHAESILERVGSERLPLVRELFRNLVTAEGTRAVREWSELLSVFDETQRNSAEEVLHELIDARLLTSYEVHEEEREPIRRVEIIHESLLANWPRLVRWQTQDADAVQLRDQLRQAARTWDERSRSDDMLWTGSAYREYQLWRERYAGGLTEIEEEFARAMTSLATRRRRRRRIAMTVGVAVLAVVLTIVTALWRNSVQQTRLAEAAKLLAFGELEIDSYPTTALAWATASLELADTLVGRHFALRALSKGPPVTLSPEAPGESSLGNITFSPSGAWLASRQRGRVWLRFQDGRQPILVGEDSAEPGGDGFAFASDDELITAGAGVLRWWSVSDVATPLRMEDLRGSLARMMEQYGEIEIASFRGSGSFFFSEAIQGKEWIHWWPFDGGTPRLVGGMEPWLWGWNDNPIDSTGSWIVYAPEAGERREVYLRSLDDWSQPPRLLGELDDVLHWHAFHPDGGRVATLDESNEISIWSTGGGSAEPIRSLHLPGSTMEVDYGPGGRWLAVHGHHPNDARPTVWLLDLAAPQGATPLELRRSDAGFAQRGRMAFHPSGDWLVASPSSAGFWPLTHSFPWVLDHGGRVMDVAFTPDGKWLLSVNSGNENRSNDQLRAWPLQGQNSGAYRILLEEPFLGFFAAMLAIDPSGEHVAVGSQIGSVYVVPVAGGPAREFSPVTESVYYRVEFSPDGRLLAVAPHQGGVLQVWDLETGESREIGTVNGRSLSLRFVDERRLLWSGTIRGSDQTDDKIVEQTFDLDTGATEITSSEDGREITRTVSRDGSVMLTVPYTGSRDSPDTDLFRTDLATGMSDRIASHGEDPNDVAFDPSQRWIVTSGYSDGLVRIGPVSGEEPHLLFGHRGTVQAVAVSQDGRWIASAGDDGTVRVWPMPDLSKPPLHTLPHDELIAKLRTLTNLRAVRDEESPTGWKVEVGPFPGWETVPTW